MDKKFLDFLSNFDKEIIDYYKYVKELINLYQCKLHINLSDKVLNNSYASLRRNKDQFTITIRKDLYTEPYHFLHELIHIELNLKYPVFTSIIKSNPSTDKITTNLSLLLNNSLHHYHLERKVDKEFNINRLKQLKSFNKNYSGTLVRANKAFKNNRMTLEYFVAILEIVIDSKIRRVNYEKKLTYTKCNIELLDKLSDQIIQLIKNTDISNNDDIKKYYLDTIKLIQSLVSNTFKQSIILKRRITIKEN